MSGMKATLRTWTPNIREAAARVRRWVERSLNYILFAGVVGIAVGILVYVFEGSGLPSTAGSRSVLVRNVGLVLGGLAALWVAVWRSRVADRQAKATQQQADTAQRSLLDERYQKSAEMLGSDVLTVRLGGIYALHHLAEEYPERYHIQIMRLLCSFVCHPTRDEEYDIELSKQMTTHGKDRREDIKTAVEVLCARHAEQDALERGMNYRLHLENADLSYLVLHRVDLSRAFLVGSDLSRSILHDAHLSHADLTLANLNKTELQGAILTGAQMFGVKGMTQRQLDETRADPRFPPHHGLDAETGEPLVWRGKPLEDRA